VTKEFKHHTVVEELGEKFKNANTMPEMNDIEDVRIWLAQIAEKDPSFKVIQYYFKTTTAEYNVRVFQVPCLGDIQISDKIIHFSDVAGNDEFTNML
jgi:hypothetical protein